MLLFNNILYDDDRILIVELVEINKNGKQVWAVFTLTELRRLSNRFR